MKPPLTKLLFFPFAALLLGLVAAETGLLVQAWRDANAALTSLHRKRTERAGFARPALALTTGNETALAADLTAARHALDLWTRALQGDEAPRPGAMGAMRSPEAFFELTKFVGQLRAQAVQAQVAIRPDERFGFAGYANEGPPPERIKMVLRQLEDVRLLVETLLAARPRSLLAVRRKQAVNQGAPEQRTPADDYFTADLVPPLGPAGLIEADAFRLEFTGQTAVLRNFLNRLVTSRPPAVVRGVEAEPLGVDNPPRGAAPVPPAGTPLTLTQPGIMRFGVIVELARPTNLPGGTSP